MASKIKTLQRKAESLWKECCLLRDGRECQVQKHFPYIKTSHSEVYQVDHCFSRRLKRHFLSIANGTVVCSSCNLNKNHNDAIYLAIHEIVKEREGSVYERMKEEVEQGGAFLNWRNIGWLEDTIETLKGIKELFEGKT